LKQLSDLPDQVVGKKYRKYSMIQFRLIPIFLISILLCFPAVINAQEIDTTETEINIKNMRLPLPAYANKSIRYTIDDEIANLIADILERIGVNDVFVGIELDSTFLNIDSTINKYTIVTCNELNGIREAIVVSATEIFQFNDEQEENGTYFKLKRSIFKKKPSQKTEPDSTNIYTEISVFLNFIDIETGDNIGYIDVTATHTGGSLKQSKEKALENLWDKLMMELKKIYWLSFYIESTTNGKIKLPFGTNYGIKKGKIFELVEPDRIWEDEKGEYIVAGGRVGFATVSDTTRDSSKVKIIRLWQDFYPESWVVEYPYTIQGFELNLVAPSTDYYLSFGIQFHANPMQKIDWGFGMQIIQVADSFGDKNFGFGFSGFGIWRFLNGAKFDIGAKLGINIDIPFKEDDNGQIVNTALFSTQIGIIAEYPLSEKFDIVFGLGYRFGVKSSEWEFSENDETFPAYWRNDSPEVDNTGYILSTGFKYYLY